MSTAAIRDAGRFLLRYHIDTLSFHDGVATPVGARVTAAQPARQVGFARAPALFLEYHEEAPEGALFLQLPLTFRREALPGRERL
jgi:hypothetical protein